MRIESTADVDLELLTEVAADLPASLHAAVEGRQVFMESVEPPSWVLLVADVTLWLKAIGGIYIAAIAAEAGKTTWQNRAKALATVKKASSLPLTAFAAAIAKLRTRLKSRTTIGLGLPVPHEHFGSRLRIQGSTPEEIALEVAVFLHHLPALNEIIEHEAGPEEVLGTIVLRLREDFSLEVQWMDQKLERVQKRILPPPSAT